MTRGDGSLTHDGRTWRAQVWVGGDRKRRAFHLKADAEKWLATQRRLRVAAAAGLELREKKLVPAVTFADLEESFVEWLDAHADRERSPATREGYLRELALVLEYWGRRIVARTDRAAVLAYVAELRKAGLAGQTIRNRLGRLRQLARLAVTLGYLPAMPEIPVPRPGDTTPRTAATEDELVAGLKACPGPQAKAALLLAADAGLRRMEIVELRGRDVDLEARWLTVRRGKGGKPRRVPILSERLLDALTACRAGAGDRVCLADTGPTLDSRLKGLPSLHRLRHYRASRWANDRRIPLPTVMAWLGHARLATTQRYIHAVPDVPEGVWEANEGTHDRPTGKVVRIAGNPRGSRRGAGRNRTDE